MFMFTRQTGNEEMNHTATTMSRKYRWMVDFDIGDGCFCPFPVYLLMLISCNRDQDLFQL